MKRSKTGIALGASLLALVLLMLASGCGKDGVKLSSSERKAFDNAPAEAKATWENALAADKANDYPKAQRLLDSLTQMSLSDDQKHALDSERAAFGQRLMAAAEKNDAAAVQAIRDSQNSRGRRPTAPAQ